MEGEEEKSHTHTHTHTCTNMHKSMHAHSAHLHTCSHTRSRAHTTSRLRACALKLALVGPVVKCNSQKSVPWYFYHRKSLQRILLKKCTESSERKVDMAKIPAKLLLSSGSESMWSDCAAPMEKPPVRVRVCMRVCVCVRVCACVRVCVRASVRARVGCQTHRTQCD